LPEIIKKLPEKMYSGFKSGRNQGPLFRMCKPATTCRGCKAPISPKG